MLWFSTPPWTSALCCLILGTGLSNAQAVLGAPRHLGDFRPSKALRAALPSSLPSCSDEFQPIVGFDTMSDINGLRVLVDFIVNTDGRVDSPFILESSGENDGKLILSIIKKWRFRPVICGAARINVELRVLFVGPRRKLPHPMGFRPDSGAPQRINTPKVVLLSSDVFSEECAWVSQDRVVILVRQPGRMPVSCPHACHSIPAPPSCTNRAIRYLTFDLLSA